MCLWGKTCHPGSLSPTSGTVGKRGHPLPKTSDSVSKMTSLFSALATILSTWWRRQTDWLWDKRYPWAFNRWGHQWPSNNPIVTEWWWECGFAMCFGLLPFYTAMLMTELYSHSQFNPPHPEEQWQFSQFAVSACTEHAWKYRDILGSECSHWV